MRLIATAETLARTDFFTGVPFVWCMDFVVRRCLCVDPALLGSEFSTTL
jgi:hypothetical protein